MTDVFEPKKTYEVEILGSLCVIYKEFNDDMRRMLKSVMYSEDICHFDEVVLVKAGEETDHEEEYQKVIVDPVVQALKCKVVIGTYTCPYVFELKGKKHIGDFAAARNYCFGLASGRWRMFLDSDDELIFTGSGEKRRLTETFARMALKGANCISFDYAYSSGEQGVEVLQTRIAAFNWCENGGQPMWRWDLPIHEEVVPTAYNPGQKLFSIKSGPKTHHIKHYGDTDTSFDRNFVILSNIFKEYKYDTPPKLLQSYSSMLLVLERFQEAAPIIDYLVVHYPKEVYGYMGAVDIYPHYNARGNYQRSLDLLLRLYPYWSNVRAILIGLAETYAELGENVQAIRFYKEAYLESHDDFNYRSIVYREEIISRMRATEFFMGIKDTETAIKIIEGTPKEYRDYREVRKVARQAYLFHADYNAADNILNYVNYLLSCDRVYDAKKVVDTANVYVRKTKGYFHARAAVHERLRHFKEPKLLNLSCDKLQNCDIGPVEGRKHLRILLEEIRKIKPKRLIDVGCNTGWLIIAALQEFPDMDALGIDIGDARLDFARELAEVEGLGDRCKFINLNLEKDYYEDYYPVPNTLVVTSEVIEHVENPSVFLYVLKDFGAENYIITTPDQEEYYQIVVGTRGLDPLDANARTAVEGKEHVNCWDMLEFVDLLHENGMIVDEIRRIAACDIEGDKSLLLAKCSRSVGEIKWSKLRELKREKDRQVDIYCEGYVPWGPNHDKKGHIGGSEQAVVNLAPLLKANVRVWASPMDNLEYVKGVKWDYTECFDPREYRDAVIIWRRAEKVTVAKKLARGHFPVILWAHDIAVNIYSEYYKMFDEIWALSPYHKELFVCAGCDPDKVKVLQNGIDVGKIKKFYKEEQRHGCAYTSSADRGLLFLLHGWKKIKDEVPDAELHVFYRMDLLRRADVPRVLRDLADDCEELMDNLDGVTYHGGLPHEEYLEKISKCSLWTYPCTFPEISCIAAMEAQALGLQPVVTDFAALKHTVLSGSVLESDVYCKELQLMGVKCINGAWYSKRAAYSPTYIKNIINCLKNPVSNKYRRKLSLQAVRAYDWVYTASLFDEALTRLINGDNHKSKT